MHAPTPARFLVLASSSSGNCSVVLDGAGAILIDLGLSPRRTLELLARVGVEPERVRAALVTHLDDDHLHPGWAEGWSRVLPSSALFCLHARHRGRAARAGQLLHRRTLPFDAPFDLGPTRVEPALAGHDDLGSVVYRLRATSPGGAHLGLATDLGRATEAVTTHLRGVPVLAIESNYCPALQEASARPDFLKRRIMGGYGHLSNAQCARAVREIAPGSHVVLLHLSRQCNRPDLASREHAGAPYALTIAAPDEPTPWIELRADDAQANPPSPVASRRAIVQPTLF